jgi:hypothetical protein
MEKDKGLKRSIKKIIDADYEVHHIFKEIVSNKSAFTQEEEIIEILFIERNHLYNGDNESKVLDPAKLLVATTHGLLFSEEGFKEITEDYYGYKMQHIYYDKISSLELDICLLEGKFKVISNSSQNPEIEVNFNTAEYFKKFEHFINTVRKTRIKFMHIK